MYFKKEKHCRYDPVSAHFILISKKDESVLGTVRLVPYPMSNLSSTTKNETLKSAQFYEDFPIGDVWSETAIINDFLRAASDETIETPSVRGAKLTRLAVRKENRGNGLGALTVREAEKWLMGTLNGKEKLQDLTMIISSQMQVKMFYEKIGYVCQGEPYDEDGMVHIQCRKQLVFEGQK